MKGPSGISFFNDYISGKDEKAVVCQIKISYENMDMVESINAISKFYKPVKEIEIMKLDIARTTA